MVQPHIAHTLSSRETDSLDCDGVRLRSHRRHQATVVSLWGEVTSRNAGAIGTYLLGQHHDMPLIVDASGLTGLTATGIDLFDGLDEAFTAAGTEWTLVTDPASAVILADCGLPVTTSVRAALADIAEATARQRRIVMALMRKSA